MEPPLSAYELEKLLQQLQSAGAAQRLELVQMLGRRAATNARALEALEAVATEDPVFQVRQAASQALLRLGRMLPAGAPRPPPPGEAGAGPGQPPPVQASQPSSPVSTETTALSRNSASRRLPKAVTYALLFALPIWLLVWVAFMLPRLVSPCPMSCIEQNMGMLSILFLPGSVLFLITLAIGGSIAGRSQQLYRQTGLVLAWCLPLLIGASVIIWWASIPGKWNVIETTYPFSGASFSPDGKRILAVRSDGKATVWDTQSGERLLWLVEYGVDAASFSPDGLQILTGSARFSNDARQIVAADGGATIWDTMTGKKIKELRDTESYRDKMARVWQGPEWEEYIVLSGHSDHIQAAAFSPVSIRKP